MAGWLSGAARRVPAWLRPPRYGGCLLLVLPLVLAWSLATPVQVFPDGMGNLFTAAADARGQFGGALVSTPWGREEKVQVPGQLTKLTGVPSCVGAMVTQPDAVPTSCALPPGASNSLTTTTSQFQRYPPLFYLLVGWPTLLLSGTAAYWGATIVAAVLNALMLALALWTILNFIPRRLMVFGWLAALTPQVLYLGGGVNAGGFEISTAAAAWSGLLALALSDDPPARLVATAFGAAALEVLTRPLSPLWVLIALVATAVVAGPARLRALAALRRVRRGAGVLVTGTLLAGVWRLAVGAPIILASPTRPARPVTLAHALRATAGYLPPVLISEVGNFNGYPVSAVPLVAWAMLAGVLCVAGFALAPRRTMWCLVALGLLVVLIPLAEGAVEFNRYGYIGQGKDWLPYSLGLPLIAAAGLPEWTLDTAAGRRLTFLVLGCFATGSIVAFVYILHRYANGIHGPWSLTSFRWQPPLGFDLLSLVFVLATVRVMLLAWRVTRPSPGSSFGETVVDPDAEPEAMTGTHASA